MKFKLDENLPLTVADVFNHAGNDALSVIDQHLAGASNATLAQICREEGRILVTLDLDFADIRAYPPEQYSGMIVLRLQHQDALNVVEVCRRLMPVFDQEPIENRLWIVDEKRLRIRE
jgi:predicted nuclease of predicted toxin-antitoxin system